MAVAVEVTNLKDLEKALKQINTQTEKALNSTIGDMKSRAPGWINAAVTKEYNIKKSELPTNKTMKASAASLRITGNSIKKLRFNYSGRLLTPIHFKMSPSIPTGKNYKLKATILKGKRVTLGTYKAKRKRNGPYADKTGGILMPTGTKNTEKVSHIPFQRMSRNRKDVHVVKTVSVPQMIQNEKVHTEIYQSMNEGLTKRLNHNIDRNVIKKIEKKV